MVQVLRSVYDGMIAHALTSGRTSAAACWPVRTGGSRASFRATNVADRKAVRYEAAPREILRIMDAIDDADLEHLGIYHSHPNSRLPFGHGLGLAAYPVFYVIVSLVDFRDPQVKAYTITDGEVTEEPIEIV